jgi:hypothetical protein
VVGDHLPKEFDEGVVAVEAFQRDAVFASGSGLRAPNTSCLWPSIIPRTLSTSHSFLSAAFISAPFCP